jgi:hypothetical protein
MGKYVKLAYLNASFILLMGIAFAVSAQDISISASVDRNAGQLGDAIAFTIQISGTQAVDMPSLPEIEGFRGRYVGPSTQISIINGRQSVSVAHNYSLLALKTGKFIVPSIQVKHKGKTYRTKPIEVEVIPRSDTQGTEATSIEELKEYLQLSVSTPKKTAYLNEGIPLLIQLLIRDGIEVSLSNYPTFPSLGLLVLPFEEPTKELKVIDGIRYQVINFRTTVYPVKSGELDLGPVELNCDLIITRPRSRSRTRDSLFDSFFSDSFFDRRERYAVTLESDPHMMTVRPLPKDGQPDDFSGAVGKYDLSVVAKPTTLKVGEPITLTMTVEGEGNIDGVNAPGLENIDGFKIYDPQINFEKQGNAGRKTFEQVLIPHLDSVRAIPEARFTYFDPESERYVTRTEGPIPISVEPSEDIEPLRILEMPEGKPVQREILGRDIVYIKDDMGSIRFSNGPLYKNRGFLLLQLVPLLGFAGTLVYQRRRERFATDRTYARQYHAPRKAKKGLAEAQKLMESGRSYDFFATIYKTVQEYLGDRFDLSSAGITIEIVDILRSQNISEEILEKLTSFFQACDRIRFAQYEVTEDEMKSILDLADEIIVFLEDGR